MVRRVGKSIVTFDEFHVTGADFKVYSYRTASRGFGSADYLPRAHLTWPPPSISYVQSITTTMTLFPRPCEMAMET